MNTESGNNGYSELAEATAKKLWSGKPAEMSDGTPLTVAFRNEISMVVGWYGPRYQTSYYFPKAEHAPILAKGIYALTPQHPAENLPGAVGTLKSQLLPNGTLKLHNLQGCFKIGSTPDIKWRLLRIYTNWREELINKMLARLNGQVVELVFLLEQKYEGKNEEIMSSVAEKLGFQLKHQTDNELVYGGLR